LGTVRREKGQRKPPFFPDETVSREKGLAFPYFNPEEDLKERSLVKRLQGTRKKGSGQNGETQNLTFTPSEKIGVEKGSGGKA